LPKTEKKLRIAAKFFADIIIGTTATGCGRKGKSKKAKSKIEDSLKAELFINNQRRKNIQKGRKSGCAEIFS